MAVEMMLACGSLSVFFLAGAYSVVYAYTPENYPTEVRGTGTGTAMSWGRIGGIVAPTAVGFLYPLIGLYMTLTIVSLGFVLAALAVAFLGTETKGKNLEACSVDNPEACEPGAAD
jgi:putative MFS transporter